MQQLDLGKIIPDIDKIPTESSENAVSSGGVFFALQQKGNPNLLDNSYWAAKEAIINQHGDIKYVSSGYTIDRWILGGSYASFSVEDDCIRLSCDGGSASSSNVYIQQRSEIVPLISGKTVTLSILYRTSGIANQKFGIQIRSSVKNLPSSENWTLESFTAIAASGTAGNAIASVYIGKDQIGHLDIKAIKLELGDTQTLAHKEGDEWVLNDPPPNYALELAKCQRYQVVFRNTSGAIKTIGTGFSISSSEARIFIPTPVTMRANPTISNKGKFEIYDPTYITVQKFESPLLSENGISINVFADSQTAYRPAFLRTREAGAYLILNANL